MTAITLHCPLCSGALQIDDSMLGQQVQCPLCQGLLQLPPADLAGGPPPVGEPPPSFDFSGGPSGGKSFLPPAFDFGEVPSGLGPPPLSPPTFDFSGSPPPVGPGEFGPPPPPPAFDFSGSPPPPPPPGGEFDWNAPISLGCPVCGQPFQITAALAGQTVACPHCAQPVQLPPWEAFQPAAAPSPQVPMGMAAPMGSPVPEVPRGVAAPMGMAVPSGPSIPPGSNLPPSLPPVAPAAAPKPEKPRDPIPRSPAPLPAKPKTDAAKSPAVEKPKKRRPDPAATDLLPPGAGTMLPPAAQDGAHLTDLFPPGADMLPPSSGGSGPANHVDFHLPPQSAADVILPPSAGGDGGTLLPGMEQALPEKPREPVPKATAGTVVLPTADGKYVTIREQGKIVGHGEDEIELKRLSSDEKAYRRMIRNLILGTICIGLIAIVMYVMIRVGPRPGKKGAHLRPPATWLTVSPRPVSGEAHKSFSQSGAL